MARQFQRIEGPHSVPGCIQWAIQAHDLSTDECHLLREIITNSYMDSNDYKNTRPAQPFLQGYDERSGWALVEFWTADLAAIDHCIAYINERFQQRT